MHEQHKPPSDPGLQEKGKPKAQNGRKSLWRGCTPQHPEFPWRPNRSYRFTSSEASTAAEKISTVLVRYLPFCPIPQTTNHPSIPTGRRVAAELRFRHHTSPWARHSLSPLSRRFVFSSSRAPPGPVGNAELVAVQLAEQGKARQGKARQGKARRVGALPRRSARYPSSSDCAAAARMLHRVVGLSCFQFRVRDSVACPTRSTVLPKPAPDLESRL